MERRNFILGAMTLPLLGFSTLATAGTLSLDAISDYFNQMSTAKGKFTQTNPNGTQSFGTFYIHRPGRIRFEYERPDPTLLIAGGGQVAIFDKKSNNGPTQYPLRKTPLSLILKRKVDLKKSGMILDHKELGNGTSITAQDPETPEAGRLELIFSSNPIALKKWIITDNYGRKTEVDLGTLEQDVSLNASLFNISATAKEFSKPAGR